MMENKQLITLTPLGRFFFGGDMTFSTKNKEFDEKFSSYIIESGKFPQQTSLLGMLRYLILSHNEKAFNVSKRIIQDKEEAGKLIGTHSFCLNTNKERSNFGCIKSLSPCFLQVRKKGEPGWKNLMLAPRDFSYSFKQNSALQAWVNGREVIAPVFEGYNPKEWCEPLFINDEEIIKSSDIFCRDSRIGIDRDFEGTPQDNAFYKQIGYRLGKLNGDKEFRFAFNVTIECDLASYDGSIVSVGGDNSYFALNVGNAESITLPSSYQTEFSCDKKLVLLSDAYLGQSEVEQVKCAITETLPFRFLESTVEAKSYSILHKDVKRSKRLRLYQKGSVFFGDDSQIKSLEEALKKREDFFQIGYNHYQVISNVK